MRRKVNHDKADGICGTLFGPQSDWVPPKSFPNLTGVKMLGLDIESCDPNLRTKGPGFIRGDARVVGVSLSATDQSWYFPIGHLQGGNMDRSAVTAFLKDTLGVEDRFIVGANLQYELEGLSSLGVGIRGKLIDVQIAEALIDEESLSTSLEALCRKYGFIGKDEDLLKQAATAHGFKDVKGNLWKLHSKYVGPYAEFDAFAPLKIFEKQLVQLSEEELTGVFQLECELLPLLWEMRKRGIKMDVEKANGLSKSLLIEENELRRKMEQKYGDRIDEWSGPKLGMICDRLGIKYPRTPTGMPSFTADYIEGTIHPFLDDLSDLRELSKMRETFVDGWILDNLVGDRIHPQWRQIATDEGGTRTGRMAAANPNPQQVPAGKYRKTGKPNNFGALIRSCFIPHEQGLKWMKADYSEQEPRILTHFAALCNFTRAQEMADFYNNDRTFKIYPKMMEWCGGIDKRVAKDLYLGRCYGMGIKKLAFKLNASKEEAQEVLDKFDRGVPFVKEIADMAMIIADRRGYVKTLLGRRRHFNLWEPINAWKLKEQGIDTTPVRKEHAEDKWHGMKIRRANTHKALNAIIQGSGADMAKASMLKNWKESRDLPYMQVHDELNYGVTDEAHANKLHAAIESSVDMKVRILSNVTIKEHWT